MNNKQAKKNDNALPSPDQFHYVEKYFLAKDKMGRLKLGAKISREDERVIQQGMQNSFVVVDIKGRPTTIALASFATHGNQRALGSGASGQVKNGFDQDGNVYAIKIINDPTEQHRRELYFSKDMGIALSERIAIRETETDKEHKDGAPILRKGYIVHKKLGQTLSGYLRKNPNLSNIDRLKLAYKLANLVAMLHNGELSKSGEPYAHLDLKPENILIDENGDLHLIDFGLSMKGNIDRPPNCRYGTPCYILDKEHSHMATGRQADIIALIRTLVCPKSAMITTNYQTKKHVSTNRELRKSILTDQILEENQDLKALVENLTCASGSLQEFNDFYSGQCNVELIAAVLNNVIERYDNNSDTQNIRKHASNIRVNKVFTHIRDALQDSNNPIKSEDDVVNYLSSLQNNERTRLSSREIKALLVKIYSDAKNSQSPFYSKFRRRSISLWGIKLPVFRDRSSWKLMLNKINQLYKKQMTLEYYQTRLLLLKTQLAHKEEELNRLTMQSSSKYDASSNSLEIADMLSGNKDEMSDEVIAYLDKMSELKSFMKNRDNNDDAISMQDQYNSKNAELKNFMKNMNTNTESIPDKKQWIVDYINEQKSTKGYQVRVNEKYNDLQRAYKKDLQDQNEYEMLYDIKNPIKKSDYNRNAAKAAIDKQIIKEAEEAYSNKYTIFDDVTINSNSSLSHLKPLKANSNMASLEKEKDACQKEIKQIRKTILHFENQSNLVNSLQEDTNQQKKSRHRSTVKTNANDPKRVFNFYRKSVNACNQDAAKVFDYVTDLYNIKDNRMAIV